MQKQLITERQEYRLPNGLLVEVTNTYYLTEDGEQVMVSQTNAHHDLTSAERLEQGTIAQTEAAAMALMALKAEEADRIIDQRPAQIAQRKQEAISALQAAGLPEQAISALVALYTA